jgi:hypothetical protein
VLGTRESARIAGSHGCVPRPFFARVSGTRISRVTFTLDGRRVATVRRPDSHGNWKVRVNPGALSLGVHRIVAQVDFRNASQASRRTANAAASKTLLRLTFQRCARKASGPKFTG